MQKNPRNKDKNTSMTNTAKYNAKHMCKFMKNTTTLWNRENEPKTIQK